MTERFRLGYVCGDYGLIDNDEWIDLHSMSENSEKNVQICINKMNELTDENEQLKDENKALKKQIEEIYETIDHLRNKIIFFYDYDDGDDLDDCKKEIKKLKKENNTLKLLVQNWEQLDDDEKDEQLEKMNDSLKKLVEENKQLQQELFESEYENICERYHDNPIRRDNWVEDLKEEFKERFGRNFE